MLWVRSAPWEHRIDTVTPYVQVPPLLPLGVERLKLLAAWCMEPKAYIKGKVIMAASDAPTRVVWVKAGQCKLLSDPRAYEEELFSRCPPYCVLHTVETEQMRVGRLLQRQYRRRARAPTTTSASPSPTPSSTFSSSPTPTGAPPFPRLLLLLLRHQHQPNSNSVRRGRLWRLHARASSSASAIPSASPTSSTSTAARVLHREHLRQVRVWVIIL